MWPPKNCGGEEEAGESSEHGNGKRKKIKDAGAEEKAEAGVEEKVGGEAEEEDEDDHSEYSDDDDDSDDDDSEYDSDEDYSGSDLSEGWSDIDVGLWNEKVKAEDKHVIKRGDKEVLVMSRGVQVEMRDSVSYRMIKGERWSKNDAELEGPWEGAAARFGVVITPKLKKEKKTRSQRRHEWRQRMMQRSIRSNRRGN